MKKIILSSFVSFIAILSCVAMVSAKTYITGYDVNNNYKPVQVEKGVYVKGISLYPALGAIVPAVVANFQTSLASKLTSSETSSMTLVSGTTEDGTTLNGVYGFTLDEGTSNKEYIIATCINTACSSLTRGISYVTGSSSVAALKFEHRRGASVKITDHPVLSVVSNILNGRDDIPTKIYYNTSVLISASDASSTLASKYYVDNVAVSGAPDATETVKGISELATKAEAAAGTSAGGTSARLALPASMATSSSDVATTSIPVTEADGDLNANFIGQDQNYTWTGTHTFATSTIANLTMSSTTLNNYPTASSSAVTKGYVDNKATTYISYASSTDFAGGRATTTINHNFGYTPSLIKVFTAHGGGGFNYSQGSATSTAVSTQQGIWYDYNNSADHGGVFTSKIIYDEFDGVNHYSLTGTVVTNTIALTQISWVSTHADDPTFHIFIEIFK